MLVRKLKNRWSKWRIRAIFDADYYHMAYPDVAAAGADPLLHYLASGWKEGRNPNSMFDTTWYLAQNPDVAAAGANPLLHYVRTGWKEGRNPSPEFDILGYLAQNPDVVEAGAEPLHHFLTVGRKEGRNPNPLYDSTTNLKQYLDVDKSGVNSLKRNLPLANRDAKWRAPSSEKISLTRGPEFEKDWRSHSEIARQFAEVENPHPATHPDRLVETSWKILRACDAPPRVSVIIPTWNRTRSVSGAIISALNQTYKPCEIILSDDGSEDDTLDTVSSLFASEIASGQLKLIKNKHSGVSAARNAGLKIASGDVIAYLDSDNKWRPEYLQIMSAVFAECEDVYTAYAALKSHNNTTKETRFRALAYDRKTLLSGNFIDLNVFMHRRCLNEQLGGFDEKLTRLVDWDVIIRYTKLFPPLYLPFCGVDYYLDHENLQNISFTEDLDKNFTRIARKTFQERIRLEVDKLRIAYFVYDYPALSQTFVMNELRWLIQRGFDVKVFYAIEPERTATLDFEIDAIKVTDANDFAKALIESNRNICHSHFAYPGVTLFVQPACEIADINYTFMPHAVDIFHHNNRDRSRLDMITNDERCLRAFVYGDHHRKFLQSKGANRSKIAYNFQAIEPSDFAVGKTTRSKSSAKTHYRGIVIARFIEKKGIEYLIDAAALIRDLPVSFAIYGYGPLEEEYNNRIAKLGLNNFDFHGPIEGKEALTQAYHEADFLVAPCVEAANGDVDGFPTVILEAIAASKPVITTAVSAMPDYLRDGLEAIVARPRDAASLASAIRRLLNMSEDELNALNENASSFLSGKVGIENTIRRFLDVWQGYQTDVFLVTYNTEEYDDREETFEIIKRILERTTTEYTLTIIDNGSGEDFIAGIKRIIAGRENVRLILNSKNLFCGPASNLALSFGDAEFAIYVCSKEGFVKNHGWERALIERMRKNPDYALAGYKTHLPKYTLGKELTSHPEFEKFRNQNFAIENPTRPFRHVQGGSFIIRRETLLRHGWFNERLPQNNMDVEYSYFLESRGALLGEIPEVRSLSVKSRPKLDLVVDERTVLAHPLSLADVSDTLDATASREHWRCNICSSLFTIDPIGDPEKEHSARQCNTCNSTPFGRTVAAILAHNHRTHRSKISAILSQDDGLSQFLGTGLYRIAIATTSTDAYEEYLAENCGAVSTLIIDLDLAPPDREIGLVHQALDTINSDGLIVLGGRAARRILDRPAIVEKLYSHNLTSKVAGGASSFLAFDWRPIRTIERKSAQTEAAILCE